MAKRKTKRQDREHAKRRDRESTKRRDREPAKRRDRGSPKRRGRARDWALVALAVILVVGLGLRVAYLVEAKATPDFAVPLVDPEFHDYWARGLAFGNWSPPAGELDPAIQSTPFFRPPGYPYFLAAIYRVLGPGYVGPRVVQILFGLLNVVLAFLLARRCFGRLPAVILSALMAVYWIFVYYDGELLSPTITIALMLTILHLLLGWSESKRPWLIAAAGFATGVLALVRPNALAFVPLFALWAVWVLTRRRELARAWVAVVLLVAGTAVAVAPATIRNAVVADDPVLITSNAGINLSIGNNESAEGLVCGTLHGVGNLDTCFDHRRIVQNVQEKLGRRMKDSEVSRYLSGQAFAWMRANPGRVMWLLGRKTLLFWGPAEVGGNTVADADRAASVVLRIVPLSFPIAMALGLVGACFLFRDLRRRKKRDGKEERASLRFESAALVGTMILVWYGSHLPFGIEHRYRVPITPLLFIFGAYLLAGLWSLWKERETQRLSLWGGALVGVAVLASFNYAGYETDTARWHYQRGLAYARVGKIDEAIVEYQAALEHNPDYGSVYNDAAIALAMRGRYEESLRYFAGALRVRPGDPTIHYNHAVALEILGRFEESRDEYEETVRLEPRDAEARAGLERVSRTLAETAE